MAKSEDSAFDHVARGISRWFLFLSGGASVVALVFYFLDQKENRQLYLLLTSVVAAITCFAYIFHAMYAALEQELARRGEAEDTERGSKILNAALDKLSKQLGEGLVEGIATDLVKMSRQTKQAGSLTFQEVFTTHGHTYVSANFDVTKDCSFELDDPFILRHIDPSGLESTVAALRYTQTLKEDKLVFECTEDPHSFLKELQGRTAAEREEAKSKLALQPLLATEERPEDLEIASTIIAKYRNLVRK